MDADQPEVTLDRLGNAHIKGQVGSPIKTGWEDAFLDVYRNSGIVRKGIDAAGITYPLLARRLKSDPDFAERYEFARRDAVAILEAAAWKRAVSGISRTKSHYYKGQKIQGSEEVETEYSDSLLKFLLAANDPQKYREQVDHNYTLQILRAEAEKIADQEGLSREEVVAEAERIMYGRG